eukprot:1812663-Pyramimonas_sp.AAC.1
MHDKDPWRAMSTLCERSAASESGQGWAEGEKDARVTLENRSSLLCGLTVRQTQAHTHTPICGPRVVPCQERRGAAACSGEGSGPFARRGLAAKCGN